MLIKQIRSTDDTGTLSYIVADETTKSALVIDPNLEDVQRILLAADALDVEITHLLDTHTHADHISGLLKLKEITGAQTIMHAEAKDKYKFAHLGDAFGIGDILRENVKVEIDRFVEDDDDIMIGGIKIKVLHTPGHTNDHIALLAEGHLFTGDLLLIGQAGRSDLPGGNAEEQYDSLFMKIMKLPNDTIIHPGHDYDKTEFTTLAKEKVENPFLAPRSKAEYVQFVHEFFPPTADNREGKVVLQCGVKRVADRAETFTNISVRDLRKMINNDDLIVLDVREPGELRALGAIEGVVNIPVGDLVYGGADIARFKGKKIAVICQTGGRSIEASHFLASKGIGTIYNVAGGTLGWLLAGFPVERPKRMKIFA
jgi:glyoxylase-like metal-dependent hydrolase (beta-lactamase superfamily II)/rhodanese-related sulfurtransferase